MKCDKQRMPKILSGISIIFIIATGAMFLLNLVSSIVVLTTPNIIVNGLEIASIITSNVLMPVIMFSLFLFNMNIDEVENIGKRRYFVSTEELGQQAVDRAWKISLSSSIFFVLQALVMVFLRRQYRYPDVFVGKVILRNISLIMWIIAGLLAIAAFAYFQIAHNKYFYKENANITNWTLFLIDVDYVAEKFAEEAGFDEEKVEKNRKAIMEAVRQNFSFEKYQNEEAMIEVYAMNKALNYCREKK